MVSTASGLLITVMRYSLRQAHYGVGSRPSSAGASLTQTIRLQQQVRELQQRLQNAQVMTNVVDHVHAELWCAVGMCH